MQPSPNDARIAGISKITETKADVAALQQHLKEVVEGDVFKVSPRSVQFLQFIVTQAIAGRFDSLKERFIGMELFGRSASDDTGDDAIVRVTASDVRRRLLEHYGRYGTASEFRITLPSGSYIPEITRKPNSVAAAIDGAIRRETISNPDVSAVIEPQAAPIPQESIADTRAAAQVDEAPKSGFSKRRWIFGATLVVILNLALWSVIQIRLAHSKSTTVSVLPWSALFGSSRSTQLITSDPNMPEIERFTGGNVSVSDYAAHNYYSGPNKLTPEEDLICRTVLDGKKADSVDTSIVVNIAQLAQASSASVHVHPARSIEFSDLKTDDNFIFLGSPRSNPWSSLFSNQLDFRFVFDSSVHTEFIRNVHPRSDEQSVYVPEARGSTPGQSFAVIALVPNPDQDGQVLLLAGADREGTAAAGRLATDQSHCVQSQQQFKISKRSEDSIDKVNAQDADSLLLERVRRIPQVDVENYVVRLAARLQLEPQADPTVRLIGSGIVAGGDGINKREKASV